MKFIDYVDALTRQSGASYPTATTKGFRSHKHVVVTDQITKSGYAVSMASDIAMMVLTLPRWWHKSLREESQIGLSLTLRCYYYYNEPDLLLSQNALDYFARLL